MKSKINYGSQFIDNKDIRSVSNSLKERLITTGKNVVRFEENLKKKLKCNYVISCSSATSGLHLAYMSINLKKDDVILMPAINFISSFSMDQKMNAKVYLVDIDTKTGQINTFIFEKNGWSYEAFIQQEFAENKNVDNLSEEERRFETKIQVKVLGYLIGEGINRVKPKYSIRENRAEIRISRERVIVGDKRPWLNNDDFDFKE